MSEKSSLTILIPVYFGEDTLRAFVAQLLAQLAGEERKFEVLLVDDGSRDNSWEVIEELAKQHPGVVRGIRLSRNFGQHNALMCGFHYARGDIVITMDDDGQHPPEEIAKLLETLEKTGADVVYGVPRRKEHHWLRNLASAMVRAFFRWVFRLKVDPSPFRAIRREIVQLILPYDLSFVYLDGLLAWYTDRFAQVEVEHHPRLHGRSTYTLRKLITLAFNLFTNFAIGPLQVVSLIGFASTVFGLILAAYYLVMRLVGQITVPGFATVAILVLVMGGLQLLSLGLIGEYLGRVHLNVNRKPQFAVRAMTEPSSDGRDCQ
jgi:undecaprenyl-phosphate 4-deoxy-4-formamido-L-arabinose transferase